MGQGQERSSLIGNHISLNIVIRKMLLQIEKSRNRGNATTETGSLVERRELPMAKRAKEGKSLAIKTGSKREERK
jgi:hypothetical protein